MPRTLSDVLAADGAQALAGVTGQAPPLAVRNICHVPGVTSLLQQTGRRPWRRRELAVRLEQDVAVRGAQRRRCRVRGLRV
eukprot:364214-Chlamydomonas_euryale.AAC.4